MDTVTPMDDDFIADLAAAINRHSQENQSNTPDFVLAKFLARCLDAFNAAVVRRAQWYGRMDEPASIDPLRSAVEKALNELGVPGPGYPAPVANAVRILREALDGA